MRRVGEIAPGIPAKSGIMLGVGETVEEVEELLRDLRAHHCSMVTLGQYLRPSGSPIPVARYYSPDEFDALGDIGRSLGFSHVQSSPLTRSSYHAWEQARAADPRQGVSP